MYNDLPIDKFLKILKCYKYCLNNLKYTQIMINICLAYIFKIIKIYNLLNIIIK